MQSWKYPLALFFFLTSFFCFFSSGILESEDGWLYASVARNIYYHQSATSQPYEYPEKNVHMNTFIGPNGKWQAPGSLGYSLTLVPAVAAADLLHRWYDASPPEHFPLQSDWSFHLFASFTNAFFGAVLGVFLFAFARELGFSLRSATLSAILIMTCTYLFPLTRFSFPHMLFAAFLTGSFWAVKCFTRTHKWKYLLLASCFFLVVMFSYNITYVIALPALFLYLFVQVPRKRQLLFTLLGGASATLAFLLFPQKFIHLFTTFESPFRVLLEGIVGFLVSPGKSVFLYSPPLVLLVLFWHKLRKSDAPEVLAFGVLSGCYLFFVGSAFLVKGVEQYPIWHGGMVWGPRYISAIIPLLMLLVMQILRRMDPWQRKYIALPFFVLGLLVQIPGVTMPYLLQYRNTPYNIFVGGEELPLYDYASFIPRYSPFYTLSKEWFTVARTFPTTISRGTYNVRFFDGFDLPYYNGSQPLRGFREYGHILFDSSEKKPVKTISFVFRTIPDSPASASATTVSLQLNQQLLTIPAPPNEDVRIQVPVTVDPQKNIEITLSAHHPEPLRTPHVVYILQMEVNATPINLGSLDYPDVSTLGAKTTLQPYRYYGKVVTDHWKLWDVRARIRESTFDIWWIKNLYYWDTPRTFIWTLFWINTFTFLFAANKLFFLLFPCKNLEQK